MGMKEDDVIEDRWSAKQIEKAQRKVEAHNFDIRKNLLDFDDVNNDQRKVIYGQRDELLEAESVKDNIDGIRGDVVADLVGALRAAEFGGRAVGPAGPGKRAGTEFGLRLPGAQAGRSSRRAGRRDPSSAACRSGRQALFDETRKRRSASETMRALEKHMMLTVLDQNWKEHLARMDYLRQGIHLRGYAQKQPKQEYKKEAFELFSEHAGEGQARSGDPARARAHPQRGRSRGAGGAGARAAEAVAADAVPAPGCRRRYGADEEADSPPKRMLAFT
jgi:preprotein translocase subunit SecA